MYKLIALDMDGTLFNSDKQITDRTKETLAQARALGVKIVLASGRPLAGLQPPLKELDLIHEGEYVLSFNGALIVDAKTGEAVSKCILTIFIQGIIDLLVEEADGLILLDYKTDNCTQVEAKAYYAMQIELYAQAASEIIRKPIKEKYLYLFHDARLIKM